MESRIVLITGSNSGIGKAAAFTFAEAGYRVVMACRDLERSRPVHEQVQTESGNRQVELMELDLSSFASIRSFCTQFKEKYHQLDILIHNAAIFNHGVKTYQLSEDGLELTFAVNVFGPHLMTELLLERMTVSQDPRVLTACSSSIKYFFDPNREIEFDNLQGEFRDSRTYNSFKMYGDSKMGLLLLTKVMADEYERYGISVNSIMIPATRMSRERLRKFNHIYRLIAPIVQNLNPWSLEPDEIAQAYFQITTESRYLNQSGLLFDNNCNVIDEMNSDDPLPLLKLAGELWNSRHSPPYASKSEHLESMWSISSSVIRDHKID